MHIYIYIHTYVYASPAPARPRSRSGAPTIIIIIIIIIIKNDNNSSSSSSERQESLQNVADSHFDVEVRIRDISQALVGAYFAPNSTTKRKVWLPGKAEA